jgi:hypothetical protein
MLHFTSTFRRLLQALTLLAVLAAPAWAQDADVQAIRHTMKAQFDKPEAPLQVEPVVVQGRDAVAGWVQGPSGGRALLRKEHGRWSIVVCGGDGLKDAAVLEQTGLSKASAASMAAAVVKAEGRVAPAVREKFSLFKGLVQVDAGHGAHGAHPAPVGAKTGHAH